MGGGGAARSASLLFGVAGVTPAGTPRLLPTGLNSSMDLGAMGSLIRAVLSLFQLTIAPFCSRAPTCEQTFLSPTTAFPNKMTGLGLGGFSLVAPGVAVPTPPPSLREYGVLWPS